MKTHLEMANEILEAFLPFKKIELDYEKISDVEVDGIHTDDYPDFCDAFICSATYDGRDMTEAELDILNNDGGYVYDAVISHLF